ncbi:MAG: hypothetical protein RSC91_11900 [Clostridia bacterium]
MYRLLALALLMMTLCTPAPAKEQRIVIEDVGFSFVMPRELIQRPIPLDARAAGARCGAQNKQGTLFFGLIVREAPRSEDVRTWAARAKPAENVRLAKPISVDGCEFLLSAETVREAGETVTFRMATTVCKGQKLLFFFVDRTNAYKALPEQIVRSFENETNWAGSPNRKEETYQ